MEILFSENVELFPACQGLIEEFNMVNKLHGVDAVPIYRSIFAEEQYALKGTKSEEDGHGLLR